MSEQTIFEACVSAVSEAADDVLSFEGDCAVVRTIIQTIIDRTPSPRTVDELTRILLNEEVSIEAVANLNSERGYVNIDSTFSDKMTVLQLCSGDAIRAEMAWAWLNKTDAS